MQSMEFWGIEVKPGETAKCDPGEDGYLHLSQASLGESKTNKGSENVLITLKFNDQKLVLGTLSAENCPQISYDSVFEKEFEVSHNSKNMSIYFCGYKTVSTPEDDIDGISVSSEEDIKPGEKVNEVQEEQPMIKKGKPDSAKVDLPVVKPKVKIDESKEAGKAKVDEEDEDDDDSEEDESSDVGEEDESDEEDLSSDEDAATPKKAEVGTKRPAGSSSKTPPPEKKAKLISPPGSQKTGGGGKKGAHPATPHPAKQAGKTPANNEKSKQQTPKSAGSVTCKSCSRTFNSDGALQAHSKAKHGAGN